MFRYYISSAQAQRLHYHADTYIFRASLHLEQNRDPAAEKGAATHYVECFELESAIEAFSYHFIAAWDDRARMVLVSWVNAVAARSSNGEVVVL